MVLHETFHCKIKKKQQKHEEYLKSGLEKLNKTHDLLQLLKIFSRVKLLEKLLLSRDQLKLSKFAYWNFLNRNSTPTSDIENDEM